MQLALFFLGKAYIKHKLQYLAHWLMLLLVLWDVDSVNMTNSLVTIPSKSVCREEGATNKNTSRSRDP